MARSAPYRSSERGLPEALSLIAPGLVLRPLNTPRACKEQALWSHHLKLTRLELITQNIEAFAISHRKVGRNQEKAPTVDDKVGTKAHSQEGNEE